METLHSTKGGDDMEKKRPSTSKKNTHTATPMKTTIREIFEAKKQQREQTKKKS